MPSVNDIQKKASFKENNILGETKEHINIVYYSKVAYEN
jgi:hypothetical protein